MGLAFGREGEWDDSFSVIASWGGPSGERYMVKVRCFRGSEAGQFLTPVWVEW